MIQTNVELDPELLRELTAPPPRAAVADARPSGAPRSGLAGEERAPT